MRVLGSLLRLGRAPLLAHQDVDANARELRHSQPKQARNHRRDRRFIRRRHRQKGGHQTRRRLVVPPGRRLVPRVRRSRLERLASVSDEKRSERRARAPLYLSFSHLGTHASSASTRRKRARSTTTNSCNLEFYASGVNHRPFLGVSAPPSPSTRGQSTDRPPHFASSPTPRASSRAVRRRSACARTRLSPFRSRVRARARPRRRRVSEDPKIVVARADSNASSRVIDRRARRRAEARSYRARSRAASR